MKKLIDFKNSDLIQAYADKRFDGNFSLAVTSVMDAVSRSAVEYGVGAENKGNYDANIDMADVFFIGQFVGSDLASMIGLPPRTIDMLMRGIDSTIIYQEFKSMEVETASQAMGYLDEVQTSTSHGENLKRDYAAFSCALYPTKKELQTHKAGGRKHIELNYKKEITDNFKSTFPGYTLVGTEVKVDDSKDKIDILATCDKTHRHVIIELKIKNKAAHKQLRSYAHGFDNPILISVTEEMPSTMCDGIIYKTYKDIGIEGLPNKTDVK